MEAYYQHVGGVRSVVSDALLSNPPTVQRPGEGVDIVKVGVFLATSTLAGYIGRDRELTAGLE